MMSSISEGDGDSISAQHILSADIVILGAGYGGLHVAQRMVRQLDDDHHADGAPWSIVIVDRQPHHQLTTELPRIIGNEVADRELDIPLDQLLSERKDQFLQTEIQAIRPSPHAQPGAIETSAGRIQYRYVIIALGSVSNDFGVPGVRQYMRPFLTTEDARHGRAYLHHHLFDTHWARCRWLVSGPDWQHIQVLVECELLSLRPGQTLAHRRIRRCRAGLV
jgi:NADH dehydrogenase FAD-containing subunit